MSELNQRVREARKMTGLSQEDLAAAIGVSRGAVAQWEMSNGTSPSVDNMILLAQRSGMHFEYLATGRGPKAFGAPVIAEEQPSYKALDAQQRLLLELFAKLSQRRKNGLIDLIKASE